MTVTRAIKYTAHTHTYCRIKRERACGGGKLELKVHFSFNDVGS